MKGNFFESLMYQKFITSNTVAKNSRKQFNLTALCIGTSLFACSAAGAATPLGSYGQTELQQMTGDSVQITCAGFIAAGAAPGSSALFDTCRSMVQSANQLNGSGPTGDSLNLTSTELAASLQQIATEEFTNTETISTELSGNRLNTFLTRLSQVRSGTKGLTISGFGHSPEQLLTSHSEDSNSSQHYRGGSAGDSAEWQGMSFFITGNYGMGDGDATARADAYDFDTINFTFGGDYSFSENFIAGLAISYFDIASDFDVTSTVSGGGVDADGFSGTVYGTYYKEDFYIDGLVGYTKTSYDISRSIFILSRNPGVATINENASASPDSNDFAFSIGGGYDLNKGGITYGPYARLTYLYGEIDSYSETGAEASGLNLRVEEQNWISFTSVLGISASYSMNMDFGVLVPQGRIGWIHEFADDPDPIVATYVADPRNNELIAYADDPDSDYLEVGVGLAAIFPAGWQAFVNYEGLFGLSDLSNHLISVGVRWEM